MGSNSYIDLTGPHPPSRQGATYILTALDAYTRFLIAVPFKNKAAITVAEALVQNVFLPFGSCQSLVSDQGTEFCNVILEEVTKLLGIRKLRTSAYRASANGRIERVHRTMNTLLSKLVSDNQSDWQSKLPFVVTAINASQHDTTGYSPFYLLFGREYCTPLDVTLPLPNTVPTTFAVDYVEQFQSSLREAYV
jgi:transposase InsO family protein